ncbi:MAG: hypothetical protein SH847_09535 [Roseiflexaceae bacterium]|nr:hypothetical protein [Roseiflexaceae bacterium]
MTKSQSLETLNPFMMMRSLRDATLETWSKTAIDAVNTDLFAQWLGAYMNTSLAASAPIQRVLDQYMQAVLPRLNMPSRDEVTGVARRLTNIEMRLDDLDGRIDDILQAVRTEPAAPVVAEQSIAPVVDARLQAIEARLDTLLTAIQSISMVTPTQAAETPKRPARRSNRKPATPAEE